MSNEDKVTINECRKCLRMVKIRYIEACEVGRGLLLDEMEAVTGLHRKSLIRLSALLTRHRTAVAVMQNRN